MNPVKFPLAGIFVYSSNTYRAVYTVKFQDAAGMLVKAQLATKIGDIICSKRLTQLQAADILSIPQPKLSGMLRDRFRGISEAKMIE